jgi:hypothetical protein
VQNVPVTLAPHFVQKGIKAVYDTGTPGGRDSAPQRVGLSQFQYHVPIEQLQTLNGADLAAEGKLQEAAGCSSDAATTDGASGATAATR